MPIAKSLTQMTVAELDAINSLDEVLKLEYDEAKAISDELDSLPEKRMTSAERLQRRRELNDKTRQIHRIVHVWRKLHKPADAGPDQEINAVRQDARPEVGESPSDN